MKSNTLLLSLFFLFAFVGLKAQENTKYEYATVKYTPTNAGNSQFVIHISKSDGSFETVDGSKDGKLYNNNLTSVLKKVKELNNEGWDVYNTNTEGVATLFFLRKKQ